MSRKQGEIAMSLIRNLLPAELAQCIPNKQVSQFNVDLLYFGIHKRGLSSRIATPGLDRISPKQLAPNFKMLAVIGSYISGIGRPSLD